MKIDDLPKSIQRDIDVLRRLYQATCTWQNKMDPNPNCLIVLNSIGGKVSLKPLNHSVGNMLVVELVFNGHRLKRKRREEKNLIQ